MSQVVDLLTTVDSWYKSLARGGARIQGRYWPSEASAYVRMNGELKTIGACARAMYYFRTGMEPTNTPSATGQRKMSIGKIIEIEEVRACRNSGIPVIHNEKFMVTAEGKRVPHSFPSMIGGQLEPWQMEEFVVSGEVDAIMKQGDTTFGVEYKTGYGYMFQKECIGKGTPGSPKLEHLMQTMLYLHAYPEIPYWLIVYLDRGDCMRRQHTVMLKPYRARLEATGEYVETKIPIVFNKTYSTDISVETVRKLSKPVNIPMAEIMRRFSYVKHCVDERTEPPRDYQLYYTDDQIEQMAQDGRLSKTKIRNFETKGDRPGDWNCSYCAFLTKCYSPEEIMLTKAGPTHDNATSDYF